MEWETIGTPFLANLGAFFLSAFGLVLLVVVGELLRKAGVGPDNTRRLVHLGVGLFVVGIPFLFTHPAPVLLLALFFVVTNYVAWRRAWFAGTHDTNPQSWGTITFPLALVPAIILCWWIDSDRLFMLQIAFLILAISDPLASFIGLRSPGSRVFLIGGHQKTVRGSLAFFVSAVATSFVGLYWAQRQGAIAWEMPTLFSAVLLLAAVTTLVELLGRKGWDNFFIVQAAILFLIAFHNHHEQYTIFLWAAILSTAFGVGCYLLQYLDFSGAVSGGLLAFSLVAVGGWMWLVPSFAFFVLSSGLSKFRKGRKTAVSTQGKGSRRDAGQVYANGGVGWVLLLAHIVLPSPVLYWGFIGAFAAATADTWSTEIGTLSKRQPRMITNWQKVKAGTDGAITPAGTSAALLGALAIGVCTLPFISHDYVYVLTSVSLAGLLGALLDSLLGATLQRREGMGLKGGEASSSKQGVMWLGNDQVNWFCTLTGAGVMLACFLLKDFAS